MTIFESMAPTRWPTEIRAVVYVDSALIDEQTETIVDPSTIVAAGFLIAETEDYVTLAREMVRGGYRGQLSIPKVAILAQQSLKISPSASS